MVLGLGGGVDHGGNGVDNTELFGAAVDYVADKDSLPAVRWNSERTAPRVTQLGEQSIELSAWPWMSPMKSYSIPFHLRCKLPISNCTILGCIVLLRLKSTA